MTKRYLRALGYCVAFGLLTTACEKSTVEPQGPETPTTSTGARVAATATRDNNLALGNPSGAVASTMARASVPPNKYGAAAPSPPR